MSDHLRRAKHELDGLEHRRPSREECLPPTDDEVEAARRWCEESARPAPSPDAQ